MNAATRRVFQNYSTVGWARRSRGWRELGDAHPSARRQRPLSGSTKPPAAQSRTAKEASTSSGQRPNAGQPTNSGPLTWRSLAVFLGIGTGGLAYYNVEKQRNIRAITGTKTIGKAAVGGPFNLVDKDGNAFTEEKLLGRWTLIYFGFTMCPDVCPDELTKVSEALDILTKHGKKIGPAKDSDISPILISVDPDRDTPERTHEYALGFHSAFTGLSGTHEEVKKAAKAYRVYYSKDETPGDEYLVDHSIITYLMDPNGEFSDFYAKTVSAVEMAARIEGKLLAWKSA